MVVEPAQIDLEILLELSEIPLKYRDRQEALRRIAALGRKALRSHACALVYVDRENREIILEAWDGFVNDGKRAPLPRRFPLGSREEGFSLDYDVTVRGDMAEYYDLQQDGQGVVNPSTAARFRIAALLRCPLKIEGQFLRYISHFSDSNGRFTDKQKKVLEIFAAHAALTIERFEHQWRLEHMLQALKQLSDDLLTLPEEDFLGRVLSQVCDFLDVPICIVWKLDKARTSLRVVKATPNVGADFQSIALSHEAVHSRKVGYLIDVSRPDPRYEHGPQAAARGWVSLLTAPILAPDDDRLLGRLDVYTTRKRRFMPWDKHFLAHLAIHTALCFRKADEVRSLRKHTEALEALTAARTLMDLLEVLLDHSLDLVGASNGWLSLYHPETRRLQINPRLRRGEPFDCPEDEVVLELGKGVTGTALKEGRIILVPDVNEWGRDYKRCWASTRSELAVPLICSTDLRERIGVVPGKKPVGVLNIESPVPRAFTKADEDIFRSLAEHAAVLIERFEVENKRRKVDAIEKQLIGKRDWEGTIQTIVHEIQETLGYSYVNIWLIQSDEEVIRSEYAIGVTEEERRELRGMVIRLEGSDIRADIIRTRAAGGDAETVEVPLSDDPRFAETPSEKSRNEQCVRAFLPLAASDNRVLGVVEAGHLRSNRPHIYEHDIQILKDFVSYAATALGQRPRGILERIRHELKTPINGIRSHSDFLQRHRDLPETKRTEKLELIQLACDSLLHEAESLEYFLGSPRPALQFELTEVFRDIILPALKRLRARAPNRTVDIVKVAPRRPRIDLYLDRARLTKVVANLLDNAVKYAGDDPSTFALRVESEETTGHFVLKVKDWGIGIPDGYEDKIFEDGFRAAEAQNRHVTGDGLGLGIARQAIAELGGQLQLAHNRKPTEFQILLPKTLKEPRA